MEVRHTALIFFLVLCGNCILIIWSAGDEGDQNNPWVRKSKSPWKSLQLREKDTKGKGIAVESSSAGAKTSIRERSMGSIQWTNDEIEDLLRYKYTYKMMGLVKGIKGGRDWRKITAVWSEKHGDIEVKALSDYASTLTKRMNEAAQKFDHSHREERDIDWTDKLNEYLISTYYLTEEGDRSEHGKRILAEWVKSNLPGYRNVRGEYLFNRAKAMMYGVLKVRPADLNSEPSIFRIPGKNMNLNKDHEDFLQELWNKYPVHTHRRRDKLFNDAVAKFSELEAIGKIRLCDHAKYLTYKNKGLGEASRSKKEEVERKRSRVFMKNVLTIWNTEINENLSKLWEAEKKKGPTRDRLGNFYKIALEHIPALNDLTPLQVYRHVKYLEKRESKRKQAEAVSQESMRETHDPYHYFTGDQSVPWMTQGTYHHQEWIAGTSSHRELSHQEPYLNFGSDTLHSERQRPDNNTDSD